MKPGITEGDKSFCMPTAIGVHRAGVDDLGSSRTANDVASHIALDGIWQRLLAGGYLSRSERGPAHACYPADTEMPVSPSRREPAKAPSITRAST